MKVMFIPDGRSTNSYQMNLSHSLSEQGASVYFGNDVVGTIIKYRPNIIHIHWPNYFMIADSKLMTIIKSTRFICGLLLLKLFGVKIIWTVHNIVDHEAKFRSLELLFNKLLAKSCHKLIVHCPSSKEEIEKLYGNISIEVIPHGNYIGQYKNVMTSSQAREKLNINDEDIVFLYFGQIRSYKGIPELVNTFKKLNNGNSCHAKLLIVGKPLNDEIAKDIYNRCKGDDNIKKILEFVPDEDIQIYMNAADIVVLPFKDILTSGSVILSMSFGKTIIAPAIKCIADTLDDKENFLYKEDNLFDAMQRASNTDRITLTDMGIHNLRLAEQFQWDDVGKKTYDVYQNIIMRHTVK